MKAKLLKVLLVLVVFSNNVFSQMIDEQTPENVKPANSNINGNWKLEFSDEFNGTSVNTTKWRIDNSTKTRAARPKIGIYDWRWKPTNVSVENGNLILKVHKTGTSSMTNGSINTYTKYTTQYGYFEARIKVGDAAKGTHTAFWLQGPNMGNVDGTANDGAEIDIFETAWTGNYTKSVVHIDGYGDDHKANTKRYDTPGIHSGFHTWGFHWTEHFMDIYYDGVRKVRYTDPKWIVKSPEFLWLSNGASFGVEGDQYFKNFPIGYLTETQVDYIRVWKDDSGAGADTLLNKSGWSVVSFDSEDNYGQHLAASAIDGNPFTFWHTEWKNNQPKHPHEIQIDLGKEARFYAFHYLPRQDNIVYGNIKDYQLFASNDTQNWGAAIKSGSLASGGEEITVLLDDTVSARYIKLVGLSEVNGLKYTNMAEFSLSGYYPGNVLSVNDLNGKSQDSRYAIYPNPSSGALINININATNVTRAEISIFDIKGTLVGSHIVSSLNSLIRFKKALTSGIYILRIVDNDGFVETKRLVIRG